MTSPRNLRAAIAYASLGFPVFRLTPGTKFPFRESHGELEATTDLATITDWWTECPMAGIACALRFTPWFVVDVDPRSDAGRGGHLWLDAMGLDETPTRSTVTGSIPPGRHYWFQKTVDVEAVETTRLVHFGEPIPGIDIKGLPWGYVILPPTRHAETGQPYQWAPDCSPRPGDYVPAVPPEWLVQCLHDANAARPSTKRGLARDLELDEFQRGRELMAQGVKLGPKLGPGRWICPCPNSAQHSGKTRRTRDSSTILLAPSHPGGRGRIWCSHSHCAHVR